jgi:type I restriction enzyme, S subunit
MSFDYRALWESAGGRVPEHWQFTSIEDLLEHPKAIAVGVMYPGGNIEDGIPLIKVSDVKNGYISSKPKSSISAEVDEEYKRTRLNGTELLITLVGNPGDCVIATEEMAGWNAARAIAVLRLRDITLRPWIRYILLSSPAIHLIQARLNTTVQKTLNLKDIKELALPMPSKQEREWITNIIDSIERKVINNTQTNQTLEQIAQAIFKSWFVDFEPVKAKMAAEQAGASAEQIEQAAICAISGKTPEQLAQLDPQTLQQLKTTAALFPDTLVDSELGEIPEGWEAKAFGDLLLHTIGGDWGQDEPDEKHTEMVKILRGTDLPNIYQGNDERVPIQFVDSKKLASRKLQAGDIVIEVSGGSKDQPTGRSLFMTDEIVKRLGLPLEPASFCRLFRPLDIQVGLILGLHLQKIYADGKTWLYQNQSTGISNFQTTVFLEKEIVVLPPENVKNEFYKTVMPFIKQITSAENKQLTELRDSLLPKLLSGEIALGKDQI